MDSKHVFTTGEVADLLHCHQTTVIDWAKRGFVKSYRTPGGHRRIEKESLLTFLHSHKMPIPAELEVRPKGSVQPELNEHRRPRNLK
jgi:excisionase family DNA binding protein